VQQQLERPSDCTKVVVLTFAQKTPKLIVCPAQFRTSVAKRPGSGLSYQQKLTPDRKLPPQSFSLTIVRPLIPIMKSNHGSSGTSWFVFRRIWKPYAPATEDCCSSIGAASSREMKRFRAPNMLMMKGCDCGSGGGLGSVMVEDIWRFWGRVIARDLRDALVVCW
jgi:hypothetical protein